MHTDAHKLRPCTSSLSFSLLLSWCLQLFWQRAGVCWPCEG